MLIPVGLDETRLGRPPWVSIVLLALNVLAFAATSLASSDDEVQARFVEVGRYFESHPYLEVPAELERTLGLTRARLAAISGAGLVSAPPPGPALAAEQAELDELCAALLEAYERTPERRFSLVPARGALQIGWLTHMFLHGGLGHLLGNMLVFFLVVGPFLEDAWGRPFFLAFYLVGGLAAGAAQAVPMGDSGVHVLGASGAISACLGAFALRFAHRRVRMFYWVALLVRGTFFVPAWAYALFGAAMDLVGLRLAGTGGGVAYAAHVGGFLFGLGVAAVVRATRLEERIAPEGAIRWQASLPLARAADALAGGDRSRARGHLAAALAKDADDPEALLALARLEAAALDGAAVRPAVERLLVRRLGAGDGPGARALLDEFGPFVLPGELRPATAYRAAEALERADPARALAFYEAVAASGGALAPKALLRAAGLVQAGDPERALALCERVLAVEEAPPELLARARELAESLRPPSPAPPPPPAPGRSGEGPLGDGPVRLVPCRLLGATGNALELETRDRRAVRLALGRVEAVAVGLLAELVHLGETRRSAVVMDLLLRPRPGEARVVLRIPGHAMALARLRPGLPPRAAFAALSTGLLEESGAVPIPSAAAVAGEPFARFRDLDGYEEACYGRRIGGAPAPAPAQAPGQETVRR